MQGPQRVPEFGEPRNLTVKRGNTPINDTPAGRGPGGRGRDRGPPTFHEDIEHHLRT